MLSVVVRIGVLLLTAGGAVPAVLGITKPTWVAPTLSTLLVLLVLAALFLEIRSYQTSRPQQFKSDDSIRGFMFKWISHEGRVAIFTRDMSWVGHEQRIRDLLRRKAQAGELIVCLPRRTALANELEQEGAEIRTYERLRHEPQSRFTIIRHGRDDAEVAIGRRIAGVHTISTYSLGAHSAFAMAEDLIELVTRADR